MIRPVLTALILMTTFAVGAFAAQSDTVDLESLAQGLQGNAGAQCEAQRAAVTTAKTPMESDSARAGAALLCDCLPTKMDAAFAKLRKGRTDARVAQEDFMASVNGALDACAAQVLRTNLTQRCRTTEELDLKPEQREPYCSCLENGLQKLSDEQISKDAQTASQRSQASAVARAAGKPDPTFPPTLLDELDQSCRPGKP